jgi:CDP-diacylglycerol--glycerol-3-phosphate 3-phosphatidyltransferase
MMNIPNFLTLLRIFLIPVLLVVYYLPIDINHTLASLVFTAACITDWFDGYLARVLKQISALGAFLDPLADKLIVAVALIMLVGQPDLPYLVLPAAIIVGREIAISGLREWMAELGKRASVAVSFIGKAKTLVQMFSIAFLLAYKPGSFVLLSKVGYLLLYLSAGLTLWSMCIYLKAAWPDLTFQQKQQ